MGHELLIILMSSLLLGFRHGVDWDHIAAITDLVEVLNPSRSKGCCLQLCTLLATGL